MEFIPIRTTTVIKQGQSTEWNFMGGEEFMIKTSSFVFWYADILFW